MEFADLQLSNKLDSTKRSAQLLSADRHIGINKFDDKGVMSSQSSCYTEFYRHTLGVSTRVPLTTVFLHLKVRKGSLYKQLRCVPMLMTNVSKRKTKVDIVLDLLDPKQTYRKENDASWNTECG